jgi:hypothetical protein
MALDIQAGGFVGLAFEATWGTFVPATKFFPVRSCDLQYTQDTSWRRPIRGVADNLGAINGYSSIAGTIEMELMENALPYFLYAGRYAVVKSGAINFVYTATPTAWATNQNLPATKKGLSITVVKAGLPMGFEGCVVTGLEFGVDGNVPIVTIHILGEDEAAATLPTYVEDATSLVYGAGMWNVQIPTATQVFDCDNFSFNIDEGAEVQHRLADTRIPRFVKFGERTVTLSVDRDFTSRTEYDAFKILTAQSITVSCVRSVNNSVVFTVPQATHETFEPSALSSQGDLVRASVQYQGIYNAAASASHTIVVKTQQDIT